MQESLQCQLELEFSLEMNSKSMIRRQKVWNMLIQKIEINFQPLSVNGSHFGKPQYVEVPRGQLVDIEFELIALPRNFG